MTYNHSRVLIATGMVLLLSACGASGSAPLPTVTLIPSPLPPVDDNGSNAVPTIEQAAPTIEQAPMPTAVPIDPNVTPLVPTETVCEFNATFVNDLSIPDGAVLEAGQVFDKIWRLQNNGCADWPTDTEVVFLDGFRLGGPLAAPIGSVVPAGSAYDLMLTFQAPDEPGNYLTTYQLRTPDGLPFGEPFFMNITVQEPEPEEDDFATPTPRG